MNALTIGRVSVGFTNHDNARNGVSNSPLITGSGIKNKIIKIAGIPTNTISNKIQNTSPSIDTIIYLV